MRRTSFDDLYLFHHVAKHRSISAASNELSMSIPTISRRLIALEQELNIKLFNRTRRSLTLTNEGLHYHSRLYTLLEQLGDEVELIRYANSTPVGHLKLSMPSFMYEHVLFEIIQKFQHTYSKIKLSITPIYDRELDISDQTDITFRVHDPISPDLVCRNLLNLDQCLIASQPAPQTFNSYHELKSFIDSQELISYADNMSIDLQEQEQRTWYSYQPKPQNLLLVSSPMIIKSLRASGTYSILPKVAVQEELARGELHNIAPNWNTSVLPINMIYRSRTSLPSHQRLFIDAIFEYFHAYNHKIMKHSE